MLQPSVSASRTSASEPSSVWDLLRLRTGQRGVLAGKTRTGKTTLARWLMEPHPWSVVHDGKGRINWPGYTICRDLGRLMRMDPRREPHLIYRPNQREWDDPFIQEMFFRWIYRRKRTAIYVDEMYFLIPHPLGTLRGPTPPHLLACQRQGGELGISVLTGMQRPSHVPVPLLSEVEHAYIFRLRYWRDRKKVEEMYGLPMDAVGTGLPPHAFYHAYEPEDGQADYHGPLRLPAAYK